MPDDWFAQFEVKPTAEKPPPPQDWFAQFEDKPAGHDAAKAAAGLAGLAALTAVAKPVLSRVATSQGLANLIERVAGAGKMVPGVGTGLATAGSIGVGIAKGEDPTKLAERGVIGAASGYGAKLGMEGLKLGLRQLQPAAAAA